MIYLDYAATSPLSKEVKDTYVSLLEQFANCDSLHDLGRKNQQLMNQSRSHIARLFHVQSDEIFFCGSASEANNMAIKGYSLAHQKNSKHLITTCIEHASVLSTFAQLERFGFEVTYLPVYEDGCVRLEDLIDALRKDTILVSMMHVNNETGAIQPVQVCAKYVKQFSHACFHCDGVQGLGKIKIDLTHIDMASFSAHKINGLKGSGLLYKSKPIVIEPLISGGQQEFGMRGGTSDFAVNTVFAKTLRLALEKQDEHFQYVKELRDFFVRKIRLLDGINVNSSEQSSPYIVNISVDGISSEVMLNACNKRGFAISAKSTCSSSSKVLSSTILAMGLGEDRARNAVRISLSFETTKKQIVDFIENIKEIVNEYRL